ncbi:MAG: hypothetical protein ABFC57_17075 [Veillonellales bacterium]
MEKKLGKQMMLRRKYKRYAAALAGAAIMAGTTLHGIPVAKAAATETPAPSPSVAGDPTAPIDKDIKKPIAEPDTTVTDPAAATDQEDSSDNNKVPAPDQRDNRDGWQNDQSRWDKGDRDHGRHHYDHERYKHERWADQGYSFAQRIEWYNDSQNKIQVYYADANSVDIVIAAADILGFDPNEDTFSLLSQMGSQSIVRVVHNGNNYDVTVQNLLDGNWLISYVKLI